MDLIILIQDGTGSRLQFPFLSAFISIIALIISAYAIFSNQRFHRLSVKPELAFNIGGNNSEIWFKLKNVGLGPAVIKDWYFLTSGGEKATHAEGYEGLNAVLRDVLLNRSVASQADLMGKSATLDKSENWTFFRVAPSNDDDASFEWVRDRLMHLNFHVYYESFYGEGFTRQFHSPN